MHITKMAFALALALGAGGLPAAPPVKSSPLGYEPAVVRYVSNDAPFVVFDVSPRSVVGPAEDLRNITLTFIATDALRHVHVFAYATSADDGSTQMASRVECGDLDPGYRSCAIPARELLLRMSNSDGLFGLRIEAEGLQHDHSTVVITLPVKIGAGKRPTASASPAPMPAQRARFCC